MDNEGLCGKEAKGNRTGRKDKRAGQKKPCPHSCRQCPELTTRGCALKAHCKNRRIHGNCSPSCEGYKLLGYVESVPSHASSSTSELAADTSTDVLPIIPLHVLMVLPSDFDKPKATGRHKTYETTLPFCLDEETKLILDEKIPGFLTYSFHDRRHNLLQANSWVLLFYFLLNGESIGEDESSDESAMSGRIVSFIDFLAMEERELMTYDILVGAFVGKSEMKGSESSILRHWKRMEDLATKIPFWPSLKEQHRYYSKIQTERDIDYICKHAMQTDRPSTSVEAPIEGDFVAKRTYSSDSLHVKRYTPGMTLEKRPLTTWFFQEMNPLILHVGEVKVTITDKKRVLGRVLCRPQAVGPDLAHLDDMTEAIFWAHPLSFLQLHGYDRLSLLNTTSSAAPDRRGLEEMDNFCLEALRHLSQIEKRRQTEPLSIDSLARVDIALMRRADGTLNYYVNERLWHRALEMV